MSSGDKPYKKVKLEKQSEVQLPIVKYREQIIQLVKNNQVVVISGETGSGKTTQIPQYLYPYYETICVSQPRRISAITLSRRIAEEMNVELGEEVGYNVRFEQKRNHNTKIHFLTDGMAIREMMLKKKYSIFVLDEAHERSVNTDILFSILKENLIKNKKLKLIIMSATIDISKFLRFFNSDAYLTIEGRSYPIHLYYTLEPVADYVRATINTILQIHFEEASGDILVFLTGQEQILSVEKALQQKIGQFEEFKSKNLNILTLYSALPSEMQLKIFEKPNENQRKVILSTNIAETSVTIDGIKYVVDCGFSKIRVFDHQKNLQILAVVPISKSNALQRAGRAGRQYEGKCFRLYTKNNYEQLTDHHLPQILRVDISNSLLQLKVIGIKNLRDFEFIDKPSEESINYSLSLLTQINAIDTNEQITKKGIQLSELPLAPELSNLLLLSLDPQYDCASLMLSCISILTVQNLFFVPEKQNLSKVFNRYKMHNSDHLTKVNIFNNYTYSSNKRSFCKQNFINTKNIKKVIEIRQQLQQYLVEIATKRLKQDVFKKNVQQQILRVKKSLEIKQINKQNQFLKCLATGSVRRTAKLNNQGYYIINHTNQSAKIHPQSICFLAKPKPDLVVFNEIVKTNKIYIRNVSEIHLI